MSNRNCIEADVLKVLGGTYLQCQGTQIEILWYTSKNGRHRQL